MMSGKGATDERGGRTGWAHAWVWVAALVAAYEGDGEVHADVIRARMAEPLDKR